MRVGRGPKAEFQLRRRMGASGDSRRGTFHVAMAGEALRVGTTRGSNGTPCLTPPYVGAYKPRGHRYGADDAILSGSGLCLRA
jgi:hypothetical protein